MAVTEDSVVRNRALQTEWYGEPLGDRFRRLVERLGISQAGLAQALGLSAPMLSQLMSGQRAKISNPAVLNRLQAVEEFAADPAVTAMPAADITARLAEIHDATPTTTSGMRVNAHASPATPATPPAPAATPSAARALQALLRSAASAAEIEAAAALLDHEHPDLAAILRVYGNGRTSEAEAHLLRTLGHTL